MVWNPDIELLVAFGQEKGQEKMLGVARVITGADRENAELESQR